MICKSCVLDSSIKSLTFKNGICNFCHEYMVLLKQKKKENTTLNNLETILNKISKINNKYNCLIGVSGGVDSSFVTHLAKQYDLRPLLIHFDNGWNSELAVSNIKKFQMFVVLNYRLTSSIGQNLKIYKGLLLNQEL